MNRHQFISGSFWLAISIFVSKMAIDLGLGTLSSPGPGFLFFWSSLTLGALAIVLIIQSVVEKRKVKMLIDLWKGLEWGNVIIAIIVLFAYALFLTKLGFILATFGLMILLYGMGRLKYWVTLISALITVILSYIIFHVFLQIHLPIGIFGW